KTCNSLTALLHSLSDMPDAGLILALNPHEHVYLFHALQTRLQISSINRTLGEGIAQLLSAQILAGQYERQKALLTQSEIKLLHA
ncbi:hypothetical protein MJI95_37900, partial [Salmonella enterica subsp. enterica serovar Kentucky]|nr:hypothetical protein [Salmonella enterica subsp. enterica serovar Kentucky]